MRMKFIKKTLGMEKLATDLLQTELGSKVEEIVLMKNIIKEKDNAIGEGE